MRPLISLAISEEDEQRFEVAKQTFGSIKKKKIFYSSTFATQLGIKSAMILIKLNQFQLKQSNRVIYLYCELKLF